MAPKRMVKLKRKWDLEKKVLTTYKPLFCALNLLGQFFYVGNTWLKYKEGPRFGELCSCCCLPLLPQLAFSILATWSPPYTGVLYLIIFVLSLEIGFNWKSSKELELLIFKIWSNFSFELKLPITEVMSLKRGSNDCF